MQLHKTYKERKITKSVALKVGIVLLFVVGLLAIYLLFNSASGIKRDRYQLVKLNNGEIFFGKLQNTKGDYLVLKNAYFIPASDTDSIGEAKATSTEVTLLSRKSTVAKTDSPMYIKSNTVTYWENLAVDSKISESIKGDQSK